MTNTEPTEALLNAKQEDFVQYYVNEAKGNASEAYRLAGYKTKQEHLYKAAFQLLKRPEIRARIDFLLKEKRARLLSDFWEDMLSNVQSLRSIRDSEKSTAYEKITAIKALNDMLGFNAPAKSELDIANVTPIRMTEEEMEARLRELNSKLIKCGCSVFDDD